MMPQPNSEGLADFIPAARIEELLRRPPAEATEVQPIIAKSLALQRLSLEEMAALLSTNDPDLQEEMFEAARQLKRDVYGNRIVLFAPLYIGNKCVNSCRYCGFRRENEQVVRRTLTDDELRAEVHALVSKGHKRLVIDYGEHSDYSAETIAHAVGVIYSAKNGGAIRRINVNCAPLDVPGYRLMKEAGIGTYQIFQETYHRPTYAEMHPRGPKANFLWRLYGQDRAMEGGCDDVGLGALFGLYDWRFEAEPTRPRHSPGGNFWRGPPHLFVPTAQGCQQSGASAQVRAQRPRFQAPHRYPAALGAVCGHDPHRPGARRTPPPTHRLRLLPDRRRYQDRDRRLCRGARRADLDKEQFRIGDNRSLEEVVAELLDMGEIPSFCTACYRSGRTGEHFMELAKPGEIKHRCAPNAIVTLAEYLVDYAGPETREAGEALIARELEQLNEADRGLAERLLARIHEGRRDVYC